MLWAAQGHHSAGEILRETRACGGALTADRLSSSKPEDLMLIRAGAPACGHVEMGMQVAATNAARIETVFTEAA